MLLLRRLWMLQLLIPKILAEIVVTFAMIFVGGGSIVLSERFPNSVPLWVVPVSWGLVICGMIFAVGKVSGAHFNPAVTLAFAVARRTPAAHVPFYWLS